MMFNKNMTKGAKKALIFIALIALLLVNVYAVEEKVEIAKSDILTTVQMTKDLNFVIEKMESIHPRLCEEKPEDYLIAVNEAKQKVKRPMTKEQFYFVLAKVAASLNDAHTSVDYEWYKDEIINLPIVSLRDGVYINKNTDCFKIGDQILKIGGITVNQLHNKLNDLYKYENKYALRYGFERRINKSFILRHFGLLTKSNKVDVVFLRNGELKQVSLSLIANDFVYNPNWITWHIEKENDLAYFKYDVCINNEYFETELRKFFIAVAESQVNNVVVDLRENSGGSVLTTYSILSYMQNVNEFISFANTIVNREESPAKLKNLQFKKWQVNEVIDENLKFNGELYFLISNQVNSASNIGSFVAQDNNLATLVGEPSGNRPVSYSASYSEKIPVSQYNLYVSMIKVRRFNKQKYNDDALYPDYTVYTSAEDLILGVDPQMNAIYELINMKKSKVKEELLTQVQMQQDIDLVKEKILEIHPMFALEKDKLAILNSELEKLTEEIKIPKTKTEFFFAINKMLVALGDAHTRLIYPHEQDNFINLPFRWLKDGVFTSEETDVFKVGDEILKIGGKTMEQVFNYALSVFPHENRYYIEALSEKYVNQQFFLSYFKLINPKGMVDIEFNRDGETMRTQLAFEAPEPVIDEDNWITWSIDKDNDLGYFRYDKCFPTDYYNQEHTLFFEEVKKSGVNNIVIDLRNNVGGSVKTMMETFEYLEGVDEYLMYGVTGYNRKKNPPEVFDMDSYKRPIDGKVEASNKFGGEIYILIDNASFSAANMASYMARDNGLATLIGEPSGNKPTSYTAVKKFDLPNLNVLFKVSIGLVKRIDESKYDDIALFPDYEVYTTADDLKQSRDPQLEKVYELIKSNK